MTLYYYRFEDERHGSYDADGDSVYSYTAVHLRKLKVIKETPKGVWLIGLCYGQNNPRFVNNCHKKRFAYPTIELAKESFLRRKELQKIYLKHRINIADEAINIVNSGGYRPGIDW